MTEPYMPHGWMHALVRYSGYCGARAADTHGTVVDEADHRVKVRWPNGTKTWEFKRDLEGASGA